MIKFLFQDHIVGVDLETSTFVTKRLVSPLPALKPVPVLGISSGPKARQRQVKIRCPDRVCVTLTFIHLLVVDRLRPKSF